MPDKSLIDRYLIAGQYKIAGWLDPYSADFIRALSDIQRQAGFFGALGEIGVNHGKLFILLMLSRGPDEKCFAIDIFEAQEHNVDQSGHGDRAIFEANVRRWGARSMRFTSSRPRLFR